MSEPELRPERVGLSRRVVRRMRRLLATVRAYDPRAVDRLSDEVRSLAVWVGAEDPANLGVKVDAVATNLELLKAELRGLGLRIDELAAAIAPGAGLDAAALRMAELRERLEALDRRVRRLAVAPPGQAASGAGTDDAVGTGPESGAGSAPGGSGFDYIGFEQRFRGDPATVLATQRERYLELLASNQPVLDVGCGRGELLRMLAEHDVRGSGVDLDAGMVSEAVAAGVDAHHADAIAYLRRQPEASFGAITAMHVVEHLPLDTLIELLELAASRLVPGGVFVAETPNPATLLVLGNSYILDPTHVWPLHPSLLSFLCERAGFREIELRYGSPAEDYRLALVPEAGATAAVAEAINPALERLNEVLFGPQEYAIVARTPA